MKLADKTFKSVATKGGKQYVEVKERLQYLAKEFEGEYSIDTDYQYFSERKMWVVKAKLTLTQSETTSTYTGLAQEVESEKFGTVNFTSALENAETSAVGRACAMAGIGIDISIASADEINKAHNRPEVVEPAPTMAALAPEPQPAVTYASAAQKEHVIRLLNHPVITRQEKTKMLLNINRLDEKRADEAIAKLKKTIEDRENGESTVA